MRGDWIPCLAVALVLAFPLGATFGIPGPSQGAAFVTAKQPVNADSGPSGIVFDTQFDEYSLGDVVRYFIWNLRDDEVVLSCTAPFWVYRFLDSTWISVDAHVCLTVLVTLGPGGRQEWSWTAETGTENSDLAPVEPGLYRVGGSVCAEGEEPPLVAYFRIR